MSDKHNILVKSFLIAAAISVISIFGYKLTGSHEGSGFIHRVFVLLGGNILSGGYIQFLTFFAFFWGMFDIFSKKNYIAIEKKSLKGDLLPTKAKTIILGSDINDLRLDVVDFEKKNCKSIASDLIIKSCLKFCTTKSIAEMTEILSIQVDINREIDEGRQSIIRYLTWAIPSIGFIGTVLGISQALIIANSGDMNLISSTLGIAFDTTLVALILSLIIMWYFHNLQESIDNLHIRSKEYIIENLINRIEL